ncbi:11S globulin seed storage protein 2-like [Actinidia eriantha]|uniref:11S globulin seed storage protein 2-like n=1 Tax=Actinidia eriantha TaxID=165200 RepID=UPI00258B456A|nr:11S globulin seed storage protein 2-like [Actinidia eriantha]
MATNKLLLVLCLSLLASEAIGRQGQTQLGQAQQCRIQRLTASQPARQIESEGGVTELWDENEAQFQCAGVAPIRNILRPNSLSLPNFHPAPRLVYIERGQGLLGVSFPGCAETFQSRGRKGRHEQQEPEEQEEGRSSRRDQHQKIRRIRKGDVVVLPPGVAHWCFNDGSEELVAVSITDLNHQANQLDQKLRAYYLAGGLPREGRHSQQGQDTFQNVLRGFDEELMAEAFNVPVEIVRRMKGEDGRGLIVNAQGMSMIRPDEREEEREYEGEPRSNGLEETWCTMRLHQNIDERTKADVYSKGAGQLNIVNQHKLPILRFMDMSAEKGKLFSEALYTLHWSINSHGIVYVTRGEAQVQIVDHSGKNIMNDRVKQGNMFVVPQYYAASVKAGRDGIEWLTFRTTGSPMRSPVAGYTSIFRAMPLQIITNSYQIAPSQAQDLKYNRGREGFFAAPRRSS